MDQWDIRMQRSLSLMLERRREKLMQLKRIIPNPLIIIIHHGIIKGHMLLILLQFIMPIPIYIHSLKYANL